MTEASGRVTLWAIEAFLAVADEGTVQGAARRLNASASAISQQISALEQALGAVLLDRAQRPLRLTVAGQTFCRHARAIVNELAAARAAIGLGGLSGLASFRLGLIEDFEAGLTPRLLSDLAHEWPQCQFLLETGPSHRLHEAIAARTLDLIVAADLGLGSDGLEVHRVLEEPFVAVLPKGQGARPFGPALPLILYTSRHHMGRQIADALAHQPARTTHRFELDSYASIMAMVAAGTGWTILTPLAVLHAERFRTRIELEPLPFHLSRQIALTARRDVLAGMPAEIAGRLRVLLGEMIVAPVLADHPWMKDSLRVLPG